MRLKSYTARRAKALSFVLIILLLNSTAFAAGARPQQVQVQTRLVHPLPPARYIPSHDYDTKHLALNLRFDWEREQAMGTAMISFSPLVKDLSVIELDAANMTFAAVKLASGAPLKFESWEEKQKLQITLDHPYQPTETVTVIIDYHTNGPVPKLVGLVGGGLKFIKPSRDDPARPKQIWTQGESEYNHYWFPCYDHPNDFFTTEITATVEKPLIVISNGKLMETKDVGTSERSFHWKIDQPHASYLTSMVVGEYTPIVQDYEGTPVVTNVYKNQVEEGKATAARLAEMVKFFSEKTGLKYPYAKYAQTMARDFGGGMENISATTQTDNMIHDARTELDQTSDGLQSHELAHQWFGDYVTCRSWSDIWLNESFATYFQAMWDEHHLGRNDFLYSDVKGNQDQYFAAWRGGNRRPIVTRNYATPDSVFDTYAYPRGAAVLHMLRTWLGEDNWWRAINHYLTKYAHQPVDTEQFRIAIEEATGQSMDWFFDEWLYRMGHPVFQVAKTYDPSTKKLTLTVKQAQKPDPDWQYPQVGYFQTPVDIELVTNGQARVERVNIEARAEQSFAFSADSEPQIVNFDYGSTIIKEIEFNKPTTELLYQASMDQDVAGRLWALRQLSERLKDPGTANAEQSQINEQISSVLVKDNFWGVRLEAATVLTPTNDISRQALIAAVKDTSAKVRARAIASLSSAKNPALIPIYLQSINDRSYAVIRAAALALGQTKSAEAFPALTKLIEEKSWRDSIKVSALNGLSALGDSRGLEIALRLSEKGNAPVLRAAALKMVGAVTRDDPRAFPILSKSLTEAAEKGDFTISTAAAEGLANLGDPRGLGVFEEILKNPNGSFQLRTVLIQLQERLRRTAAASSTAPQHP
ncbi:MAG TPA: M1 family aminopeptidase [Pyrinomonadaceae bacterium]|nr:M1 family aminopeptidase [Pyrinomonadaceae bacterium]